MNEIKNEVFCYEVKGGVLVWREQPNDGGISQIHSNSTLTAMIAVHFISEKMGRTVLSLCHLSWLNHNHLVKKNILLLVHVSII